jgi:hypothetical protein
VSGRWREGDQQPLDNADMAAIEELYQRALGDLLVAVVAGLQRVKMPGGAELLQTLQKIHSEQQEAMVGPNYSRVEFEMVDDPWEPYSQWSLAKGLPGTPMGQAMVYFVD